MLLLQCPSVSSHESIALNKSSSTGVRSGGKAGSRPVAARARMLRSLDLGVLPRDEDAPLSELQVSIWLCVHSHRQGLGFSKHVDTAPRYV